MFQKHKHSIISLGKYERRGLDLHSIKALTFGTLSFDRITAANDVSSRKAQFAQSQWCYSKSFDTACPLGPALVHVSKIQQEMGKVAIEGQLDGEVVQKSALE
jgi:hypothetical protein